MHQTLAAISIRRRSACLALFQGVHLRGVVVRHIPTDDRRAEITIIGFAHEICDRYKIERVAIEQGVRSGPRITRSYDIARQALEEESVLVAEVQYSELLESYSLKPLRLRQHLRQIAKRIWPTLDNKKYGPSTLDAAIVGLHFQAQRLLNIQRKNA